jgi:transcriptional regulator with XRE-family HTH domain
MDISKDLQKQIGDKLAELRIKNKQTQHDIEFLTGIDSGEVSKYEQGKRNLTIKTLAKFALALNVHPKALFNFEFDIQKYKVDNE